MNSYFYSLQTWYFSDEYDKDINDRTGGRLVVTNCSSKRTRTALACKMSAEYDHFLQSQKRYHFENNFISNIVDI